VSSTQTPPTPAAPRSAAELIAEHEAERPARQLSGPVAGGVLHHSGAGQLFVDVSFAAFAGIGATLSPPTLGATAFIIAEHLNVSYLTALLFATVPTLLYYVGIVLAIEIDARRFGARPIAVDTPLAARLLLRRGCHVSSLVAIVVLMTLGVSPFRAVAYATARPGRRRARHRRACRLRRGARHRCRRRGG
jgi:TRAP-type uncharacterized transport system fused permease subunit